MHAAGGIFRPGSIFFSPNSFNVTVGHSVTWTNRIIATHTITSTSIPSGAKSLDGSLGPGDTYKIAFRQPGRTILGNVGREGYGPDWVLKVSLPSDRYRTFLEVVETQVVRMGIVCLL